MNKRSYKRVALLGVDGAGTFFTKADTPNIDRIFADGAVNHHVLTSIPTISAECWGSMLLGVTPEVHRLTNSIVSSQTYDTGSIFPSSFRVIRRKDPDAVLASFCNWNPINYGIIEDGIGVLKETAPDDEQLTDKLCAYLEETVPDYLFVQFDNVDGAGHSAGYGTERHLRQITATDGYIARIFGIYEKKGLLDDTLFIVTADHGGFGHGHGGVTDDEKYVSFFARGRNIVKGQIGEMEIRDCASIVLHAFGCEQPETWTGRVPSGLFEGVEAGERPVYVMPKGKERVHVNVPTPEKNAADVLGRDRIIAYFPMDGSTDEYTGKTVENSGKLYFVEGYYGKGIRLDDGYITLKGWQPDKKSFSVAFWVNTDKISSDPALLSNKNWQSGSNPGFVVALQNGSVVFNAGNGGPRTDFALNFPIGWETGWVHVYISVDREAGVICGGCDLAEKRSAKIRETMLDASFSADMDVKIGQDGTAAYGASVSAVIDELIIADGIFTDADIEALRAYYGMGEN